MKANELKPFEKINHTDQLLRLDWFGGVQGNLDELDNPLIECFFTPFDPPDPSKGELNPKPRIKDQFIAGIAVGYLPIQFIGKYFRQGKPAPLSEWPRAERITFDLDVSDASVVECILPDLFVSNSDFIAYRHYNAACRAGLKLLKGTLLSSTSDKIKKFPAQQIVVIHELELIRYYLTVSSFSCKNIFTGAFTNENLKKRVVNTIHEPVTFDAAIGRGRFVYRHGYKEKDAPILGRILFDQTGLALNAAQRVHSKVLADQINANCRVIGYPRTFFPFTGKTTLTLSGRRIKTQNGFIFLAYRIHSCTSSFPYKSLSYCDEISQGGAPAPDDAPIAFKNLNALEVGPAHDDNNVGVSTSHEQPSAASSQLQIELGQREYPGLQGLSLTKEKLRDCTHRSEKKAVNYLDTLLNASTGGGTSGASTATRQSISERVIAPSPVTPDLETFIRIIRGIGTLHPEWDISTITVGNGFELDGVNFSVFPPVPCRKRKNIMRQFSYMDWTKQEPRRFICVRICASERYFYLFEAQRRLREPPPPSNSGISPYKEDMPIMVLTKQGHEEILEDDFLPMIKQTVVNTTWPSESQLGDYIKQAIHHGKGVQSVNDMCARVAQSISQNLESVSTAL